MRTSCMEVMGPIWELWGLSRTPLQVLHMLLSASLRSRKRAGCVLFFALARTQIPEMVSDVIAKVPSLPIYLME